MFFLEGPPGIHHKPEWNVWGGNEMKQEGGYFRIGEEENFSWDDPSNSTWYALILHGDEGMRREGFTSSKGDKKKLLERLKSLSGKQNHMLLGVWTGNHKTHLFVLDKKKSIKYLSKLLK
jgi:hypothetical protein